MEQPVIYLHGQVVIACHYDHIVPSQVHHRQIGFQFQFGCCPGIGFQHQHDLVIHSQAQGDAFQSKTTDQIQAWATGHPAVVRAGGIR